MLLSRKRLLVTAALFSLALLAFPPLAQAQTSSANGKYAGLLKSIYVPQDQHQYGNFYDYG